MGVPLRVDGSGGQTGTQASVDSELTLLYVDRVNKKPHDTTGGLTNPFFGQHDVPFTHPRYPIYLVTRLAAYDLAGVKSIIDRSLQAKNSGNFVIDLNSPEDREGNDWLRDAAILLPTNRTVFDESVKVLTGQKNVIAYASWGSNDPNRRTRTTNFQWLPGGSMTEYVSTDARTFKRPPPAWNIGSWSSPAQWFEGSPQSLSADYIAEGATGASGHVFEPYLSRSPRPNILLPAYYNGRTLAESFWLAIPVLSWQNIVIGDPLCSLGKPN
jgi:uncharacterized protein (TIGR03790 family)